MEEESEEDNPFKTPVKMLRKESDLFEDMPSTAWKIRESSPIPPVECLSESSQSFSHDSQGGETYCWICFESKESSENSLISVCKCNGSIGIMHVDCLKGWLNQKLEIKWSEKCTSYKWKSIQCEICKHPYKFKTLMKHDVLSYEQPEDNYMILEQISKTTDTKSIHVISLDHNELRLGRGKDLDIRISDISVSWVHALLKIE